MFWLWFALLNACIDKLGLRVTIKLPFIAFLSIQLINQFFHAIDLLIIFELGVFFFRNLFDYSIMTILNVPNLVNNFIFIISFCRTYFSWACFFKVFVNLHFYLLALLSTIWVLFFHFYRLGLFMCLILFSVVFIE
jgi:hypothetical protein